MNTKIIIFMLLVVLGLGIFFSVQKRDSVIIETPVACTEEAKLCPDGSSVGRSGPACEFHACPKVEVQQETTAGLNQMIFNNGIFITPREVLSDSRCPSDVVCISAGEITVKVLLERGTTTKEVELTLGASTVFEKYKIAFTTAVPENNSKTTLNKAEYRFTFNVTPRAVVATGTISGQVTTSPTCPVERIPSESQCSPKPYATSIHIRQGGAREIFKTIQSNNLGSFKTTLPEGTYELDAVTVNDALFPQCSKETVHVISERETVTDISCDTGLR